MNVIPSLVGRLPAAAVLTALALSLSLAAPARASGVSCQAQPSPAAPTVRATGSPLRFGIYPGGPIGAVSTIAQALPENPGQRLDALQHLRSGHPLVVHIYDIYTGTPDDVAFTAQVGQQIVQYTSNGILVELVDEYRPASVNSASGVSGFVTFVRDTVRRFGGNSGVISLQVTNEANVRNAPNASDGSYAGVKEALIAGVEAARDQANQEGVRQLRVGFNWAYADAAASQQFFEYLGGHGGEQFVRSVDWVGVDAYPGLWGAHAATTPAMAAAAMVDALRVLRRCLLPLAGIPSATPLHVSESGYPTGPSRSYADQTIYLEAEIGAVSAFRTEYNVSDYRWFDLRDSNSSDPYFESQYGLLRDNYSPKPAFSAFQRLIAKLDGPAATSIIARNGVAGAHRLLVCLRQHSLLLGVSSASRTSGPREAARLFASAKLRATKRILRLHIHRGSLVVAPRPATGPQSLRLHLGARLLIVRVGSSHTNPLVAHVRVRLKRISCASIRL